MRKLLTTVVLLVVFISVAFAQEEKLLQTTGNVTLREGPGTNYPAVSYLKQGVLVKEIARQGNWVKVQSLKGSQTGWVYSGMLKEVTQEQMNSCQGVAGFSAVCPVFKDKKETPQGESVPVNQAQMAQQLKIIPPGKPVEGAPQVPQPDALRGVQVPAPAQPQVQPDTITGKKGETAKQAQIPVLQDIVEAQAAEGELPGQTFIVSPEKATAVKMSASDVNRIVCSQDITDVVYSEEKGVQVKISGRNAFLKFLVRRLAGKDTFSTTPADVFVVCGGKVYSIIAFPQRIPSVTVYLEDKEQQLRETVEKYQSMPYERKIVDIVKQMFAGMPPQGATFTEIRKSYNLYEGLSVSETGQYVLDGEGILIRVFSVVNRDSKNQYVDVREKDFLRKEITKSPLAISLDKLRIYRGDKATMVILERAKESGGGVR